MLAPAAASIVTAACCVQADSCSVPLSLVDTHLQPILRKRSLSLAPSTTLRAVLDSDPHFRLETGTIDGDTLVRHCKERTLIKTGRGRGTTLAASSCSCSPAQSTTAHAHCTFESGHRGALLRRWRDCATHSSHWAPRLLKVCCCKRNHFWPLLMCPLAGRQLRTMHCLLDSQGWALRAAIGMARAAAAAMYCILTTSLTTINH